MSTNSKRVLSCPRWHILPDLVAFGPFRNRAYDFQATMNSAGTNAWPHDPIVKRLKELASPGIVKPSVLSRLNFLEDLARNDHEAATKQIESIIKGTEPMGFYNITFRSGSFLAARIWWIM